MGKRLYVGNLSHSTTEDSLRKAFGLDGQTVSEVHIVTDRDTGQPRGFAFVEMATDAAAKAAMQALDGKALDGNHIKVNEAKERQARTGGGGGSW
jgi:RNA recognition motif-containing protein